MAGKAGIGKVALYGREHLVAVRPQKKGLVMYTLHHEAEIRSIDQIEELNAVPTKVNPEEMKLAKQVIATFDADLNLQDYKDEYADGLRQIIKAKIAGIEQPLGSVRRRQRRRRRAERFSVRTVSVSSRPSRSLSGRAAIFRLEAVAVRRLRTSVMASTPGRTATDVVGSALRFEASIRHCARDPARIPATSPCMAASRGAFAERHFE
jgi:DNA end-binding protein Ku